MTLKRRMAIQLSTVVLGVVLLGVAGVTGIRAVRQDLGVAVRANGQLRQVYAIGARLTSAISQLNESPGDRRDAIRSIRESAQLFESYSQSAGPDAWLDETKAAASAAFESIWTTSARLERIDVREAIDAADTAAMLSALADLSSRTQSVLIARQQSADQVYRRAMLGVVAIAIAVLVATLLLSIRQHQSVAKPLVRLRSATKRLARGKLDERIENAGDREFNELASDFNAMAAELQQLYAELERRIESKSRELVRSERLASVGYLAAGVAHEINNPLGIITGYAERSLQRMGRGLDAESTPKVRQAIEIMCEEAFRCKKITDNLLSLARTSSQRSSVMIIPLIDDVIRAIDGLSRLGNRRVMIQKPERGQLIVHGNDGELRQVMLNVVMNAIEATADAGIIRISIESISRDVRILVQDDGAGMSDAALANLFEPFYSEKRTDRPGTGLGLSIVRSIVVGHGGTITGSSEGVGRGSRFEIVLPQERSSDERD